MKGVARAIAAVSILLGLFLLTRTYRLERQYAATLPQSRDPASGRTLPEVVARDTTIYVNEAEAKTLDTSRVYSTFGWPFAVLGVLLAAASRNRRPLEAAPESESPWTARR
ncbi:MAG TPA: hypothetical protein VHL80_10840 [Polyangia bacterium]|nr:hypothetical protein [Polyangia bacterium]